MIHDPFNPPENDICIKIQGKFYDITFGVDGWSIRTPEGRYTMSGKNEDSYPRRDGWPTREEAKKFLDALIDKNKK